MPYSITVDVSQIVNLATQLDSVGKQTRKAVLSALNRAGDQGYTVVKRFLAEQTGIKQADLTHGSSGLHKRLAYPETFEYEVVARSSTTPLSYFKPHQTKAGVVASPWGQRRLFTGTFIATMKSGHLGVWAHEAGAAQYVRRISPTSGRSYWSQSNIRQLFGPSIAKEMMKEPIPERFRKAVLGAFQPRLTHELERMLAAINPASKQIPSVD